MRPGTRELHPGDPTGRHRHTNAGDLIKPPESSEDKIVRQINGYAEYATFSTGC